MNNDPEILRRATMKCSLRFAMQALGVHDYEELRQTCVDMIRMIECVESYKSKKE